MDRIIRTDKTTLRLTWMWAALTLYTGMALLGSWFPAVGRLTMPCLLLSVVTTVGIIITTITSKNHHRNQKTNIMVILLMLWMAEMYLTSGLQTLWWVNYVTQYGFISWTWVWMLFLPIVPLLRSYFKTIEIISYLAIPMVMISLFRYTDNGYMQFLCEGFTLGAGLVVATQRYHSRKLNTLCYAVLILGFLTATIHARRNLMLTTGFYLMIAGCQLLFGTIIKSKATRMVLVMTSIFVLLCGTGFYLLNDRGMFRKITDRAGDNTRDYVYLHFVADFGTHPQDLITGRSLMGTYECGGVEGESGNDGQRGVVECGYLNNILKGGFIFMLLYAAVMGTAMVKGFKGKNTLAKTCSWMLLIQLSDMIFFGIHSFNLKAYLLWMMVSVCLNSKLMSMDDDEVRSLIYERKLELPKWKEA